jgi:hypothetical protein
MPTRSNNLNRVFASRRRGAAMSEMVLVAPVLLLVLVLLFYFGALMPRTERALMMARYETWRAAEANAPGPAGDPTSGHAHLNEAFFEGYARSLAIESDVSFFPDEAPETFVAAAADFSGAAGRLAEARVWLPSGAARQRLGRYDRYEVLHSVDQGLWDWLLKRSGACARAPDV